ncbi:hypothetical protein [Ottowia testudinis]|uniref:Uncharacterized protein n=1 Tax=Ottowia testudinis TaxID=2816950 RepID=A0A975CIW6_9BURK|nr:hypothetical protein [Ottowia testudinis]QTD44233.1 hypothetical protein J1M35_14010 [Ottowia testudinis]
MRGNLEAVDGALAQMACIPVRCSCPRDDGNVVAVSDFGRDGWWWLSRNSRQRVAVDRVVTETRMGERSGNALSWFHEDRKTTSNASK